jgi:hypothetical protein
MASLGHGPIASPPGTGSRRDLSGDCRESRGDALANVARVLRVSPVAASLATVLTWGRLLTAERDDRVRQRVGATSPDARPVQGSAVT